MEKIKTFYTAYTDEMLKTFWPGKTAGYSAQQAAKLEETGKTILQKRKTGAGLADGEGFDEKIEIL